MNNLPVERDQRIIRMCLALERAGCLVTVICPRGETDRVPGSRTTTVRPYPVPVNGSGVASFGFEFGWSFFCITWHLAVVLVRRGFDAVQVSNPPDVFWPLALACRASRRAFVFDFRDVCPELYHARVSTPNRLVTWVLLGVEKLTLRCSTVVIATNRSYRRIAIGRAGCRPDRVVVVRNGPALAEVGASAGAADTGDHRIVYLGVIGPQDAVHIAVLAAEELARRRGRDDWRLVVAGDGESLPELRELVADRGLTDLVEFTGWLNGAEVDRVLTGATVAVQPDPRSGHSEVSTMAKTVEYLARGLPVVTVDLAETRVSAGTAARYLTSGTPQQFAEALDALLNDSEGRRRMSAEARRRYRDALAWEHQEHAYLAMWRLLLDLGPEAANSVRPAAGRLPAP